MNNWIKVEISTPPTEMELWLWNGKVVYRGQYHWKFTIDGKGTKAFLQKLKEDGVTHWMRFYPPEPPERE